MSSPPAHHHRYRFSEHGVNEYQDSPRHRVVRAPTAQALTLDAIINRENLVQVFKRVRAQAGQGAGIDGYRYSDFSISELGNVAEVVSAAIHSQQWKPSPSRRKRIPKYLRGERRLDIRCHIDRLVSSAVMSPLSLELERIFLPTSFAYRPQRSVQVMLAVIAHLVENEGYQVIVKDDVQEAFPHVRISDVMQDYASIVADPRLLHLIGVLLRGHAETEVGIDQGDPLSPLTLNLRLHHCLDLPSRMTAGLDAPLRFRYADDLVYLCRSVSEGERAIESDDALLRQAGFRFKRTASNPVNLRRAGASASILGFRLRLNAGSVNFDLGETAFRKLSLALNRAHGVPDSLSIASSVVTEWIQQHGPAFQSRDVAGDLERIVQVLADCGFHELGFHRLLRAGVERAIEHWCASKQLAINSFLSDILLLRASATQVEP